MGNSKSAHLFNDRSNKGLGLTEERKRMDLFCLNGTSAFSLFARVTTMLQPDKFTVEEIAKAEACYIWDCLTIDENVWTDEDLQTNTNKVSEQAKNIFCEMYLSDTNANMIKPNVLRLKNLWIAEHQKKKSRHVECKCECSCNNK